MGILAMLCFVAQALALPLDLEPFGSDWHGYLRNAVAIRENVWSDYHPWRWPLHAMVLVAFVEAGFPLVSAAQAVSLSAMVAALLGVAVAARQHLGSAAALTVLALALAWPDAALFARLATPYPLFAALYTWGLVSAPRGRLLPTLCFGLAAATDPRGIGLATLALFGLAIPASPRRRLELGLMLIGAATLSTLIVAQIPVTLTSVGEQMALQRDLNARAFAGVCTDFRGAPLAFTQLSPACLSTTLAANVQRVLHAAPMGWVSLGLVVLGLWRLRAQALPLLAVVPAALLVGVEHRYLLPLIAPVLLVAVAGVLLIARRFPTLGLCTLMIGVALDQTQTLTSRGTRPPDPGRPPMVSVVHPSPESLASAWLQALPNARLIDCVGRSFDLRLYPRPVERWANNGRRSGKCKRLLAGPPLADTLVLSDTLAPTWTALWGERDLWVLGPSIPR